MIFQFHLLVFFRVCYIYLRTFFCYYDLKAHTSDQCLLFISLISQRELEENVLFCFESLCFYIIKMVFFFSFVVRRRFENYFAIQLNQFVRRL